MTGILESYYTPRLLFGAAGCALNRVQLRMQYRWGSTAMPLAGVAFAFALVFGGQSAQARKPIGSVRVGDFLVTPTRVWVPVQTPSSKIPAYHSDRFHRVAVEVTVRNVSAHISRTGFVPWLKVKPDAEYLGIGWANGGGVGVKPPELYQLLPGEESTGGYLFEVRNGATPVALILASARKRSRVELAGLLKTEEPK